MRIFRAGASIGRGWAGASIDCGWAGASIGRGWAVASTGCDWACGSIAGVDIAGIAHGRSSNAAGG